ncbi:hypothetical protein [Brevibacterium casei]|uniref:hypothetical protein n=1 Tax=Brevibacterium casei TaxID=33889 RepID=UPI001CE6AD94|nr:hypothetical protein [Brevibacterium casei]MDH5150460.1 hypothetical protein [Brevibacterium casei]QZE26572.1 hypothetical protein K4X33_05185 [Brevibacterium casei]
MAALSFERHCEISEDHFAQAEAIAGASTDWAAVAYFYSAYHAMKAAFLQDPIFDDMTRLKSINQHLMPDDRNTQKHKVRRGGNGFGVNDLVHLLYPSKRGDYERLHQSSLGVRYGQGVVYPIDQLAEMAAGISEARTSGMLVASPL